MKVVRPRTMHGALGCALFAAALSLPTAGWSQNSIYSIPASSVPSPPAGDVLSLRLVNGTGGAYADNQIYWLIIGQDPGNNNAWSYIDANGGIHPISAAMNNASGHLTKNGANFANIDFPLVSGKWIGIPRITAARMYLSVGEPVYIQTFDNGFAGPNIDNPSDPNHSVTFDWSEFTIDSGGYHGNTTRVDMFGFPLQMRVTNVAGNFDATTGELESQTRSGIFSEYASFVPSEFQSLATVQSPYRIVAPMHGSFAAGGANANYFAPYTTQYTTQEIMGASGNLASNSPVDASINRHVWTLPQAQWTVPTNFYKASPANYYAAFWHTIAIGGLSYGMPYDDYANQSSYVTIGDPKGVIFRVGWNTPVTSGSYAGAPFTGTAAAVPGTVPFANYDTGGQGVAFNVTSTNGSANSYRSDGVDLEACADTTGNGYNVGWTAAGQWFKYTVNSATTATYTVNFRVASQSSGGSFHLVDENGNNLTGTVTVPATGGWQTWTTVTAHATLSAGKHVIQVAQDSAGYNINTMQWVAPSSSYTGTPFLGAPAAIPGAIDFDNYDKGGQGVAVNFTSTNGTANSYRSDGNDLEATTDSAGNGYDLGWTSAGQWTKYTVSVSTTKAYIAGFRVASPSGGTFHLVDESGNNLTGTVTVPATGGWQNWTTITSNVNLTAGQHVLQLVQDSGGYNLNYMAF